MTVNDFFTELKAFVKSNEAANKVVTAYNRGLITFSEALKLVGDAYDWDEFENEVIIECKEVK